MFFDFNVHYPKKGDSLEAAHFNYAHQTASAGKRGRVCLAHAANIPVRLLNAVAELAKLILLSIFAAICCCKSTKMNDNVIVSSKKLTVNAFDFITSFAGLLVPINASNWQRDLHSKIFKNYIKNKAIKLRDEGINFKESAKKYYTDKEEIKRLLKANNSRILNASLTDLVTK